MQFPPEITLQVIQKINVFDRINISLTHARLSPLCFDRSLKRKSTETLTLDELCQLYLQSSTDKERNQLFKFKIFDSVRIKTFNEVVHLCMDPKNIEFVTKDKILLSLNGQFVLEGKTEKFSTIFIKCFLTLLERAEGAILLAFVDVWPLEGWSAKRCAQIFSDKLKRGQKVYFIEYVETTELAYGCADQIFHLMENDFKHNISLILRTFSSNIPPNLIINNRRINRLVFGKGNSVKNIKDLMGMMNADILTEAKRNLEGGYALMTIRLEHNGNIVPRV